MWRAIAHVTRLLVVVVAAGSCQSTSNTNPTRATDARTDPVAYQGYEKCYFAARTVATICPIHKRHLEYIPVQVRYGLPEATEVTPEAIRWWNEWNRAVPSLFPFTIFDWPEGGCLVPDRRETRQVLACAACIGAEKEWLRRHPHPPVGGQWR